MIRVDLGSKILRHPLIAVNFLSQFYWATKGRHLLFTSMNKNGVLSENISVFLN